MIYRCSSNIILQLLCLHYKNLVNYRHFTKLWAKCLHTYITILLKDEELTGDLIHSRYPLLQQQQITMGFSTDLESKIDRCQTGIAKFSLASRRHQQLTDVYQHYLCALVFCWNVFLLHWCRCMHLIILLDFVLGFFSVVTGNILLSVN